MAWRDRPKKDRFGIVGAFVGMAIAAPIAIVFAFNASSLVRYLIMAAGLLIGWAAGRVIGSR